MDWIEDGGLKTKDGRWLKGIFESHLFIFLN